MHQTTEKSYVFTYYRLRICAPGAQSYSHLHGHTILYIAPGTYGGKLNLWTRATLGYFAERTPLEGGGADSDPPFPPLRLTRELLAAEERVRRQSKTLSEYVVSKF